MKRLDFLKKLNLRRAAILLCIVSAMVTLFAISFNVGADYYIKKNPESDKTVFKTTYSDSNKQDVVNEIMIYDVMHRMANSKLARESNDKAGRLGMTDNQIKVVKDVVNQMNYTDKNYLLQVLKRWEKRDFSFIEGEHEYFSAKYNAENKKR